MLHEYARREGPREEADECSLNRERTAGAGRRVSGLEAQSIAFVLVDARVQAKSKMWHGAWGVRQVVVAFQPG